MDADCTCNNSVVVADWIVFNTKREKEKWMNLLSY